MLNSSATHLAKQTSNARMISYLNRKRESAGPLGHLLLEAVDLLIITSGDLGLEVLELVCLFRKRTLDLLDDADASVEVVSDALEVSLAHSARSHSGGTNTDTHRRESRLISWGGVLVASDVDLLENGLESGAIDAVRLEVKENHMVVSSASDQGVPELGELLFHGFGVLDDLLLIFLEVVALSLFQSNGKSGDGVVVRATLVTGED